MLTGPLTGINSEELVIQKLLFVKCINLDSAYSDWLKRYVENREKSVLGFRALITNREEAKASAAFGAKKG